MNNNTNRPCKRCLLSESDPLGLYESIKKSIDNIPKYEKTEQAAYQRRLDVCRDCERLLRGTCLLCGCYVEIRAAKADMTCPDTPDKWQ